MKGSLNDSMAATLILLGLNGFATNHPEFEEITMQVAAHKISEETAIALIRNIYQ